MQDRAQITRGKILAAAETEFSEKGLYGARVDDIARSAGVNKSMLYAYFGSKEALYKTVLEAVYQRLNQWEAPIIACANELDGQEAIRKLVNLYFAYLRENETYVRMVMWENLHRARYFDEQGLAQVRNPIRRALRQILANSQAQGVFREGIDEKQVLMTLFACTYNYFSNLYTMDRVLGVSLRAPEEMEQRAESIAQMLIAYLKRRD
ncbi:MAG TPA: TetR family transcriptional regulator [Candidatus Alectryocaccomicrobium excrementavium]|uniref:TetR family transcriptional regulator n=1 Tax=Candidatus Alectryocaccomicrobium excrementavium TaxID=2840668 RepID=A0A9D1FY83_9FIRM|nr:TetR family transcriptional regulator [Candidatus Alectryocaccomicrobium excrementavium]